MNYNARIYVKYDLRNIPHVNPEMYQFAGHILNAEVETFEDNRTDQIVHRFRTNYRYDCFIWSTDMLLEWEIFTGPTSPTKRFRHGGGTLETRSSHSGTGVKIHKQHFNEKYCHEEPVPVPFPRLAQPRQQILVKAKHNIDVGQVVYFSPGAKAGERLREVLKFLNGEKHLKRPTKMYNIFKEEDLCPSRRKLSRNYSQLTQNQ